MSTQFRNYLYQPKWNALVAGAGCLLAAAVIYAGPAPNNQGNQKQAYVRFLNGVPGRNNTLSVEGQKAFTDVQYGTTTHFKAFEAKNSNFELFTGTAAGNAPPIASNSEGLSAGDHYTVFSAPSQYGKPKLEVASGNSNKPENGKAKVNVINASLEAVNVVAPKNNNGQQQANKLFSDVGAASSAGYQNVNPLQGTLNIERSGGTVGTGQNGATGGSGSGQQPKHLTHVLQVPAHFQAGEQYTILVTGGTEEHPLQAHVVHDQINMQQAQR